MSDDKLCVIKGTRSRDKGSDEELGYSPSVAIKRAVFTKIEPKNSSELAMFLPALPKGKAV